MLYDIKTVSRLPHEPYCFSEEYKTSISVARKIMIIKRNKEKCQPALSEIVWNFNQGPERF